MSAVLELSALSRRGDGLKLPNGSEKIVDSPSSQKQNGHYFTILLQSNLAFFFIFFISAPLFYLALFFLTFFFFFICDSYCENMTWVKKLSSPEWCGKE